MAGTVPRDGRVHILGCEIRQRDDVMQKNILRPVVGLFLDNVIVDYLLRQRHSIPFYRLKKHVEAGAAAAVTLVVFSIGDVSFEPDRLRGLHFNRALQRWVPLTVPRPDVLYDRFVGRGAAQVERADYIREQWSRQGIKKINARHYFHKLDVHRILAQNEQIAPHLPHTRHLRSLQDLREMFDRSNKLYCKSSTGRRGQQVISVNALPDGSFYYSYFIDQLFTGRVNSLEKLGRIIYSVTGSNDVVVQETVDLIKINRRVVDLRGEMQRNGRGDLETVAVLVRLGTERSPVATHGDSFMFEEIFPRLFYSGKESEALRSRIEIFLREIYRCMEQAYGPFGEIAIDFAVDRNGEIWFLECNARSTRVSLLKGADRKTADRAFLNPMLYAKYIYSGDHGDG